MLVDLGVFRMWVPGELGGFEADLELGLEVLEELAYWDGSLGWCAMIGATTSMQAAFLEREHAEAVFGDARSIVVGVAEPRGRAERRDGALEVAGRWSWGSFAQHCDWLCAGCLLAEPGSSPRAVLPFVPRGEVELRDTWHTSGLRGTGSGDFVIVGSTVPDGRWVELGSAAPWCDHALYRLPAFGVLALGVAAVALGLARRSLAALVELAAEKKYVGSRRTLAQRSNVQAAFGREEARLSAARALIDREVAACWAAAEQGEVAVEQRRRLRLAATHAVRSALAVANTALQLGGGSGIFSDSPLQRCHRDLSVAATHGMVAERTWELVGRMALGVETDVRQL